MPITPIKVKHYPLSNLGRAALLIGLLLNIIVWITIAYNYQTSILQKSGAFFIVPAAFTLVFILYLLLLRYRYVLLERYPYLVNLPSFAYRLGMQNNREMEGKVIAKVFTIHCLAALYISALEVAIVYSVIPINGIQNTQLLLPSILIVIVVFLVTVFALYRSVYRSFAKKR